MNDFTSLRKNDFSSVPSSLHIRQSQFLLTSTKLEVHATSKVVFTTILVGIATKLEDFDLRLIDTFDKLEEFDIIISGINEDFYTKLEVFVVLDLPTLFSIFKLASEAVVTALLLTPELKKEKLFFNFRILGEIFPLSISTPL